MRTMVATVTAGGGHLAAAAALEKEWQARWPADTVEQLDLSDLFSPLNRRLHREGYLKLVEHAPEIWGAVFKQTDHLKLARRAARVRRLFPTRSRLLFLRKLREFKPDVLLCTHYLPIQETSSRVTLPGTGGATPSPKIVCVITDFEAHALWVRRTVDLYCVAAESTKATMVRRGVDPERIAVTGIPVNNAFSQSVGAEAVRSLMKLEKRPTLLVLGGGFGMGPVEDLLEHLEKATDPLQIIVVAGRNEALRERLESRTSRHTLRVLGFAKNMHELMTISDLIVSKPGGLTTSEALALGKPLLIFSPIPGQETANANFLVNHKAGVLLEDLAQAPEVLKGLLRGDKLEKMSRNARGLGRPAAAADIVLAARRLVKEPL